MKHDNVSDVQPFRYKLSALSPILKTVRSLSCGYRKQKKALIKVLLFHDIPYEGLLMFRTQIEALKQEYNFITPDEFHAFLVGEKELNGLNILVTFDDGFVSSKYATEHVLEPLGIKAMFFLTVGFIGLKDNWKKFAVQKIYDGCCTEDEVGSEHAPMGWEDVDWLTQHGHTIGAYTVNLTRLSTISKDELICEISENRDKLEKILGSKVDSFAYPFGDINSIDKGAMGIIQKNYTFCYSGIRGFNKRDTSKYAILRDEISINYPSGYVGFIVENGLGWRYVHHERRLNKLILESRWYTDNTDNTNDTDFHR
ncbi:MAG: polysaccharide deacetylase family protein [Candidatus Anammoxibacter sp.]